MEASKQQQGRHGGLGKQTGLEGCAGLYSKNCKCKKDSPTCLAGLIPAPGSFRKKGLWQKNIHSYVQLGCDPAELGRTDAIVPVGLKNLGNTCYVNSALQCLFMIPAFRRNLFAVQPPIADVPVVSRLRHLFASLHAGAKACADPTTLASALSLNNAVQQDGQEFFKLLLGFLEKELDKAPDPELKKLVQSLFRGTYAYKTICQKCHRPSEGSSRRITFYELDCQVEGVQSLEQSLAEMRGIEWLIDGNQYKCGWCDEMVDATRQLHLHKLPPYLCLSLKRFVWHRTKFIKVKASDKISFPMDLDMAPHVTPEDPAAAAQDLRYELAAILIHKGTSATHGHYVAHVRDEVSNRWWRFDDERVTEMPKGPLGEHGDHGFATAAAAEKKAGGDTEKEAEKKDGGNKGKRASEGGTARGRKRGRGGKRGGGSRRASRKVKDEEEDEVEAAMSEGEAMDVVRQLSRDSYKLEALGQRANGNSGTHLQNGHVHASPEASMSGVDGKGRIFSANAYMLLYRRKSHHPTADVPTNAVTLSESLREAVEAENTAFDQERMEYEEKKERQVGRVVARQREVRSILEACKLSLPSQEHRLVSVDWLRKWVEAIENKPVDQSALLCEHGQLKPSLGKEAKWVSVEGWRALAAACGEARELAPGEECSECTAALTSKVAAAQASGEERDDVLALLDALDADPHADLGPDAYYVSRTWLLAWRKRASRTMGPTSPTAGLTCPHGALLPEAARGAAKRAAVPATVWQHLQRAWWERPPPSGGKKKAGPMQEPPPQTREADQEEKDDVIEIGSDVAGEAQQADGQEADPQAPLEGSAKDGESCAPTAANADGMREKLAEFPVDSATECLQCSEDMLAGSAAGRERKDNVEAEKLAVPNLVGGTGVYLRPGASYALLPSDWLRTWRFYLSAPSRRSGTSSSVGGDPTSKEYKEPGPLITALACMFCSGHDHERPPLNFRPPAVTKRRGRWVQANPDVDALEIVELEDYESLLSFHNLEGEAPAMLATATLAVHVKARAEGRHALPAAAEESTVDWTNTGDDAAASAPLPEAQGGRHKNGRKCGAAYLDTSETEGEAPAKDVWEPEAAEPAALKKGGQTGHRKRARPLPAEEMSEGDVEHAATQRILTAGLRRGALEEEGELICEPGWCEVAVQERESALLAVQLCYSDAEVMVELVEAAELQRPEGSERKSRRARKGRVPLEVSAAMTLRDLRLKISSALGLHPGNIIVHALRGDRYEHLAEEERTLAEHHVLPNADLRVVNSKQYDDDDLATYIEFGGVGSPPARRQAVERGFMGTALTGVDIVLTD